jgi:hypothetical protein
MSILLITHSLKNPNKDYSPFFNVIKTSCTEWWHYFEETWIIVTPHSADEFAKLLYPHMEKPDRLMVVKLQKEYQGWLEPDAWNWLNVKSF